MGLWCVGEDELIGTDSASYGVGQSSDVSMSAVIGHQTCNLSLRVLYCRAIVVRWDTVASACTAWVRSQENIVRRLREFARRNLDSDIWSGWRETMHLSSFAMVGKERELIYVPHLYCSFWFRHVPITSFIFSTTFDTWPRVLIGTIYVISISTLSNCCSSMFLNAIRASSPGFSFAQSDVLGKLFNYHTIQGAPRYLYFL